jgi:hypothetical protein
LRRKYGLTEALTGFAVGEVAASVAAVAVALASSFAASGGVGRYLGDPFLGRDHTRSVESLDPVTIIGSSGKYSPSGCNLGIII